MERNENNNVPDTENSGEYRIVHPDEAHNTYADAGYIPQSEAPFPKTAHFTQQSAAPEKKPVKRRRRRGIPAGTVIAMCLICGVIGGAVGGLAGSFYSRGHEQTSAPRSAAAEPQNVTAPNVQAAEKTEISPLPAAVSDTENIGSVIYALGCEQTVGITTEVTTHNIFGQTSRRSVTGSGFILSEDGYILTNYHVIEAAHRGGYNVSVMLFSGESYPAEIVGYENDGTDLAVLKIEASGLSPVTLGSSDTLQVGERVYAIGNPLGELAYTMTTGYVSALDREIRAENSFTGQTDTINAFQIDAAVNEGNSGGPLYNANGAVVGIVTAKYSSEGVEGLGFAIPISEAAEIASELIEKGYVSGKAVLGISGETVSESVARYYDMTRGVYVWTVQAGSGAEAAGLRPGDIITALDDRAVTGTGDLNTIERSYRAGDKCTLTVRRNGEELRLDVVFGETNS